MLLSYADGLPLARTESTVTEQVADHPQWVMLRTTLLQVLEPFPHARDAIAAVLSDNGTN